MVKTIILFLIGVGIAYRFYSQTRKRVTIEKAMEICDDIIPFINTNSEMDIKYISEDPNCEEFTSAYCILVKCNLFSQGVLWDLYDYRASINILGGTFANILEKWKPIINVVKETGISIRAMEMLTEDFLMHNKAVESNLNKVKNRETNEMNNTTEKVMSIKDYEHR